MRRLINTKSEELSELSKKDSGIREGNERLSPLAIVILKKAFLELGAKLFCLGLMEKSRVFDRASLYRRQCKEAEHSYHSGTHYETLSNDIWITGLRNVFLEAYIHHYSVV